MDNDSNDGVSSKPEAESGFNTNDDAVLDVSMTMEEADEEEEALAERTCEDCLEYDAGNLRCPKCDDFSPEPLVNTCVTCKDTSSQDCWEEPVLARLCDQCEKFHCGDIGGGCPVTVFCQVCEKDLCLDCSPAPIQCSECDIVICFLCGDGLAGFCQGCKLEFCGRGDCRPVLYCDICETFHCVFCRQTDFCEGCVKLVCGHCSNTHDTECGRN